jgi:RNA polymerase sigma-70 factor, ECF subfamily
MRSTRSMRRTDEAAELGAKRLTVRIPHAGYETHALALEETQSPTHRIGLNFREVYDEHFTYVWNSLRRLGVGFNDIEDLAQEVFEVVFNKLDLYDCDRQVRPWLFGITLHVVLDHRKKIRRRHEVIGFKMSSGESEYTDPGPLPDASAELHRKSELVLAILREMEMNRRAVFVMAELGGHTMPEIAEALDVPLNTAYARLRSARREFETAARRILTGRRSH